MSTVASGGDREGQEGLTLDRFVERFAVDDRRGEFLPAVGPASRAMMSEIGNERLTASLLATNFWRAWLYSLSGQEILERYGASRTGPWHRKAIIVPREHLEQYYLVILDPGLSSDFTPRSVSIGKDLDIFDLVQGARLAAREGSSRFNQKIEEAALFESYNAARNAFSIILAPAPRVERLYAPSVPLDVFDTIQHSTAGVVVEDLTQPGRVGVTAALHGISLAGTGITVDRNIGTVIRTDQITDSAFIEVSIPVCTAVNANGVMTGLAPRGNQKASFVGNASKNRTTTIVGWDPQVPSPSQHRQACIYTGRDAQPGDSGCALVTDDGWIVGFAFERTLPGQSPVQCSWIWAESVINALQVKLI